jgi:hypothetical protein
MRPTLLFVVVVVELWCKGERHAADGQLRSASVEGCSDRLAQYFAFEREGAGQRFEIIEVLHAAIGDAQLDHGLELFRDDGLFWIRQKAGSGAGSSVG